MVGLFSKRYKEALHSEKLPYPSFSRVLRRRLATNCHEFNEDLANEDEPYYGVEDSALHALRAAYGVETLRVQDEATGGERDATDFEDFLVFAYPTRLLDALEAFSARTPEYYRHAKPTTFEKATNDILEEESSPWRIDNGRMYHVDSQFLHVFQSRAEHELWYSFSLEAADKFAEARSHLQAGEAFDAVDKANGAYQSALDDLLRGKGDTAIKTDLLDGMPEPQKVVAGKVLEALPMMWFDLLGDSNGGHVEVSRAYGELAVNLAATCIKFLFDLTEEMSPASEDALPF